MTESVPLPNPDTALFYERQYFRQVWLIVLFGIALVVMILVPLNEVLREPEGITEYLTTMAWSSAVLVFGLLIVRRTNLQLWVMHDAIHIRYWPLLRHKVIPFTEIEKHESRSYRPIIEYGGWGIRGFGDHMVYNVSGNRGVKLWLKGNKTLMLGSQRSDDLAQAISKAIP